MKRPLAILIILYLTACVCLMVGMEAWKAFNRERAHAKRRRANRQAAARICHRI